MNPYSYLLIVNENTKSSFEFADIANYGHNLYMVSLTMEDMFFNILLELTKNTFFYLDISTYHQGCWRANILGITEQ